MIGKKVGIICAILLCSGMLIAQKKKVEKSLIIPISETEFIDKIYNISDGDDAIFKGKTPVIVDFTADWCRPCKMLRPTLEEIARDYKGKLQIYEVNIDKEKELAQKLGITAIPVLMFCPVKSKTARMVGAPPKEELYEIIEQIFFK